MLNGHMMCMFQVCVFLSFFINEDLNIFFYRGLSYPVNFLFCFVRAIALCQLFVIVVTRLLETYQLFLWLYIWLGMVDIHVQFPNVTINHLTVWVNFTPSGDHYNCCFNGCKERMVLSWWCWVCVRKSGSLLFTFVSLYCTSSNKARRHLCWQESQNFSVWFNLHSHLNRPAVPNLVVTSHDPFMTISRMRKTKKRFCSTK